MFELQPLLQVIEKRLKCLKVSKVNATSSIEDTRSSGDTPLPVKMGSLEYLQKQLQREYYSVTLNEEDLNEDLSDGDQIYLTNGDLINDAKLTGHSEHKMLFDKVLSNYHKSNVSSKCFSAFKEIFH